jgi:hypothetical protein
MYKIAGKKPSFSLNGVGQPFVGQERPWNILHMPWKNKNWKNNEHLL